MDVTTQGVQEENFTKKYLPYLQELRGVLFTTAIIYIVALVVGFVSSAKLLTITMNLFNLKGVHIVSTSPFQYLDLTISTSFIIAFIITLPFLLVRLFLFAKPALKPKEIHVLLSVIPWSIVLFILGLACGVYVTQVVIRFYATAKIDMSVNNLWDIQRFFGQVLFTSLLMGLIFQIPIVLNGLIRLDIIKKSYLIRNRKYVYGGLLIVGALLPTTDAFSLVIITGFLVILFESSLLLNG